MAYQARKTEHSGAKRGRGAYWGPKKDGKRESSRKRRENDRNESRERYEGTAGAVPPVVSRLTTNSGGGRRRKAYRG